MSVTAPDVRDARGFLRSKLKAGTDDIPPRHFAAAAKEMGTSTSFNDVAHVLARIYTGGQSEDFYRELALEQGVSQGV